MLKNIATISNCKPSNKILCLSSINKNFTKYISVLHQSVCKSSKCFMQLFFTMAFNVVRTIIRFIYPSEQDSVWPPSWLAPPVLPLSLKI